MWSQCSKFSAICNRDKLIETSYKRRVTSWLSPETCHLSLVTCLYLMRFDYFIIGGGIFGCYAATFLAEKGARVCLVEKETELFQKASIVNQARLHGGYHYPRSVATAALSDAHKARFTVDHRQFVNSSFQKFYGIDRAGSFTDAGQFERFCQFLSIKCNRIKEHPLFNFDRLEALYETEEHSFDPLLIAEFYRRKIESNPAIHLLKNARILEAGKAGKFWEITINHNSAIINHQSPTIINATYSGINSINQIFGVRQLDLMHEIAEMAFVKSARFSNHGLTVMDGPFGSIMPYGLSGLLSLSSVAYTHHAISRDNLPTFNCQQINKNCTPDFIFNCNNCPAKPRSNAQKMLAQMRPYFSELVDFQLVESRFTIKTKLKSSHIDDGRPTEISLLNKEPDFWCLFSGKINSIYEIEKIFNASHL